MEYKWKVTLERFWRVFADGFLGGAAAIFITANADMFKDLETAINTFFVLALISGLAAGFAALGRYIRANTNSDVINRLPI